MCNIIAVYNITQAHTCYKDPNANPNAVSISPTSWKLSNQKYTDSYCPASYTDNDTKLKEAN